MQEPLHRPRDIDLREPAKEGWLDLRSEPTQATCVPEASAFE